MKEIYPWLKPIWINWQALSETHRVTGAMLCSASKGSGLAVLAERFAHTLVCNNSTAEPCGFCHSCALTASGNHPDVHWISPEKEGKSITVDQIRQCNKWAQESSQLSGKRVVIIEPAEAMNESASNALLKTLESLSEQCVFLLLTTNKNALLPTIISRCQKWQVPEPTIEETYQWLKTVADVEINLTGIRLNHCAPLKSLSFFEKKEYQQFEKIERALLELLRTDSSNYASICLLFKDNVVDRLNWLFILLSDVQKVHFSVDEQGLCSSSNELAKVIPYQAAYNATMSLGEMRHQLIHFTGLNSELLITNWLIKLQEDICS